MCGRYYLESLPEEMAEQFHASLGDNLELGLEPRYNIAPTQQVLAVRFDKRARRRSVDRLHWGLIPHFVGDRKTAYSMINARDDGLEKKPAFRTAFAKRRCLIPASGFFEWQPTRETTKSGKAKKQPFAIARADKRPFALAGIWENWKDPSTGEWIRSCAIVTTRPNELVAKLHDRMPVILDEDGHAQWLGEVPASAEELKALLRPYPPAAMTMWPVDPRMGRADVDEPSVIDPIGPIAPA